METKTILNMYLQVFKIPTYVEGESAVEHLGTWSLGQNQQMVQ